MAGYEFTAKTVEEAKKEGLEKLGITEDRAEIIVLEESGGFLGMGKKAKIRIEKKATDGERAVEFLTGLFERMNADAACELVEEGEKIVINVIAKNGASIIGYRGEVLDSLQALAGAVANTGREDYRRVVVDCEGYREKREETLKTLAQRLAEKAVRQERKITLEPMTPYERRIIHTALMDNTEVKTVSEGREPNRYIAIIPNNCRPSFRDGGRDRRDRRNFGDRGDRRPYGDRDGGRDRRDRGYGDRGGRGGRDRRNFGERPPVKKIETEFGASTFLGNSRDSGNGEEKND